VVRGDNALPYIRVSNITAAFVHVQAIAPEALRTEIVTEGPFRFFRFVDPDGNLIEFYAVEAPQQ
jgi:catechol 2,3-dioxygenase-like lactoylglutathione lyase family enzyme